MILITMLMLLMMMQLLSRTTTIAAVTVVVQTAGKIVIVVTVVVMEGGRGRIVVAMVRASIVRDCGRRHVGCCCGWHVASLFRPCGRLVLVQVVAPGDSLTFR